MTYLFFDIECSNCFGGINKMCEFGYILTDDKFNILRGDDIPMSPGRGRECRFDTGIYKRDPTFQFAYDLDYYFDCPEFPEYYERLRKLFEMEDIMIFGYSVDNDIRYLDSDFKRYHLDPFNYCKAYDIQKMVSYYSSKRENSKGLEDAFKKLAAKDEVVKIQAHLSQSDAKMSMIVLREMCKRLEVSIDEMLGLCPNSEILVKEYLENLEKKREDKRLHPELYSKRGHKNSETQVLWGNFYRENLLKLKKDDCIGRICTISSEIKNSVHDTEMAIDYIKRMNYVASDKIGESDFIIVTNKEDKERLISKLKFPFKGTYIDLSKSIK